MGKRHGASPNWRRGMTARRAISKEAFMSSPFFARRGSHRQRVSSRSWRRQSLSHPIRSLSTRGAIDGEK